VPRCCDLFIETMCDTHVQEGRDFPLTQERKINKLVLQATYMLLFYG